MISDDHYTEARAPLVGASDRRLQLSPIMAKVAAVALGLAFSGGMMAFGVLTSSAPSTPTPPPLAASAEIALFGPGVESGDFDPDAIRRTLRDFVDSMGPLERAKAYYEDASLQPAQWELCTIVQQCPVPKYGLALGSLKTLPR